MTALDVLGASDRIPAKDVVAFVQSCYVVDAGGYAPSPGNDPHLLSTLSAVQLLVMYDALPPPPLCAAISAFVADLQEPDGSFRGDAWGEIDTRFSFCALACLKLLGQLDIVRVDDAAAYILRCMNFDGGFGVGPESESHAGQIYCCVSALAIAGTPYVIVGQFQGLQIFRNDTRTSLAEMAVQWEEKRIEQRAVACLARSSLAQESHG